MDNNPPPDPVVDQFNNINDEFKILFNYLYDLELKSKNRLININKTRLAACLSYISKLEYVLEYVSECVSYFGLKVLVDELEFLFRDSIETLKNDNH